MSKIMVDVLNMPDELFWSDNPMTRRQHNQIRREAAREIEYLRDLCERANAQFVTAMRGAADFDLLQELAAHDAGHNDQI